MRHWLMVLATGALLVCFMAAMHGALGAERFITDSFYCDRQDQITALVESGKDQQYTLAAINKHDPTACMHFVGTYLKGATVETVKAEGQLWDIVPVLLLQAGQQVLRPPTEQWTALQSPLIEATWVPTGKESPAMMLWFQNAQTTPEARARFGWASCCSHSDRVVTSFKPSKDGEHWFYQRVDGSWGEIPDDVIHWENDPKMPEQLKREGVMFIYQSTGAITCFWPPETTF